MIRMIKLKKVLMALVFFTSLVFIKNKKVIAADLNKIQKFREEVKQMFLTGDTSKHDISKYQLTYDEVCAVFNEVKVTRECVIAFRACDGLLYNTEGEGTYIKTFSIPFPNDFSIRYRQLSVAVNKVLAGISDQMSDIEKILYVHDYLATHCAYDNTKAISSFYTYSTLVSGKGICSGYSYAMELFLDLFGMNYVHIDGNDGHHNWLQVEIDNEYYHIDPTWDDPTPDVLGRVLHKNFLLNDSEMVAIGHYSWTQPYVFSIFGRKIYRQRTFKPSSSTRFTNWFIHEVNGKLLYENNAWTFVDKDGRIAKISSDNLITDINEVNKSILVDDKVNALDRYNNFLIYSRSKKIYVSNMDGSNERLLLKIDNLLLNKETMINYVFVQDDMLTYTAYNYSNNAGNYVYDSKQVFTVNIDNSLLFSNIGTCNLSDFSNWRSGFYNWTTGEYEMRADRICLKEYQIFDAGATYDINVSNPSYKVLIRELDKNKNFLRTTTLTTGDQFKPKGDATYLAISLYNPALDFRIKFDHYRTLFQNNFTISILAVETKR